MGNEPVSLLRHDLSVGTQITNGSFAMSARKKITSFLFLTMFASMVSHLHSCIRSTVLIIASVYHMILQVQVQVATKYKLMAMGGGSTWQAHGTTKSKNAI